MIKILTLGIDKTTIDKVKVYVSQHKRSLSNIVESYLLTLVNADNSTGVEGVRISQFVKSLSKGAKLPFHLDHRNENLKRLTEKYK